MSKQPPRILIAEHQAEAQANMRDILEQDGYQIKTVGSATEALKAVETENYSVLLLANDLPDRAAAEFILKIQHQSPATAIILVTDNAELVSSVAALRSGAVEYLLKPIASDTFRADVARILEHQRKLMELHDHDAWFKAIFNSAVESIIIIDESGVIESFNPAAESMFGYSAEEVSGKNVKLLMPEEYAAEHDRYLREFRQTGQRKIIGKGRKVSALHRNGTMFPIHISISEVVLGDRRLFTGIIRDVTDLERAEERILQAERLAGIGQAMAALAHESRNALQRSQAGLEMLARRVKDQPEAMELIKRVERAQDDLHQLYEDVRKYAAPLRFKPEEISLNDVLAQAWQDLMLAREGRDVEIREIGEAPRCDADKFGLLRVFRNILDNSLAAAPDPVRITVEYGEAVLSGRPAVRIEICDNGPGMTADSREQIFDEFYTTKTHGTGLGMAICKRIILAHDGQLRAGSAASGGTCITIILPRSQA